MGFRLLVLSFLINAYFFGGGRGGFFLGIKVNPCLIDRWVKPCEIEFLSLLFVTF